MTMTRMNRFRFWLAGKIAPKWRITVHVEVGTESEFGHYYEERDFDDLPKLLEGSGRLYYTADRLSYLTIKQQGDGLFREALMVADQIRRGRR